MFYITTEEFKTHILKMEKGICRIIKPEQAQEIINIACPTWKVKLARNWSYDIVTQNNIVIMEEYYKQMREACTEEQHELFDEIFGVECPYEKDDLLFVRDFENSQWQLAYFSHTSKKKSGVFCFEKQNTSKCRSSSDTRLWKYHALTCKGLKLPTGGSLVDL